MAELKRDGDGEETGVAKWKRMAFVPSSLKLRARFTTIR